MKTRTCSTPPIQFHPSSAFNSTGANSSKAQAAAATSSGARPLQPEKTSLQKRITCLFEILEGAKGADRQSAALTTLEIERSKVKDLREKPSEELKDMYQKVMVAELVIIAKKDWDQWKAENPETWAKDQANLEAYRERKRQEEALKKDPLYCDEVL